MKTDFGRSVLASLATLATVAMLGACSSAPADKAGGDRPPPVVAPDDSTPPTLDGRFVVDAGGRTLALRCWGRGEPLVVFDAAIGYAGIDIVPGPMLAAGARTRVCAYDRAGLGRSDPAPPPPRDLDDLTADLVALLEAAGLHGPVVLAGHGDGTLIAYHYARMHPAGVNGLLLIDPPVSWLPGVRVAGDDRTEPEHLDRDAVWGQLVNAPRIPHIPITVVSPQVLPAEEADYKPGDQREWLADSSHPVQIVIAGGPPSRLELPGRILATALDRLVHGQ